MTTPSLQNMVTDRQTGIGVELGDSSASATAGRHAIVAAVRKNREALAQAWWNTNFSAELLERYPNPHAEEAQQSEVLSTYLGPLLDVLAEYAESGDTILRDLYLAERRRYAPHRAGSETLRSFFTYLLPLDERALLERVDGSRDNAESWLRSLHAPLQSPPKGQRFGLLTVGDCLLSEIQPYLVSRGIDAGLDVDVRYFYFSAVAGADIAQDGITGTLKEGKIDAIAVSYLTYQGLPLYRSLLGDVDRMSANSVEKMISGIAGFMRSHLDQIRALTDVPILLHNACGLPLTRIRNRIPLLAPISRRRQKVLSLLNTAVAEVAKDTTNCIVINEDAVAAKHGLRHCAEDVLPPRIRSNAAFHYARLGLYLADEYFRIISDLALFRKTKLLLVDFDNTLWDGVMAEGSVTQFSDRQRILKSLSDEGILLAAVSKNDLRNIRWDEMLLSRDDFVSLKVNWNLKSQSVQEIANTLNLGVDSFVLIDDNPAEREMVKSEHPQLVVLDSTLASSWQSLQRLHEMPNTRATDEARARTRMYREQSARSTALSTETNFAELMQTLSLTARIGLARKEDVERVSELVQRTNQFNTTTIRYSKGEVQDLMHRPDVSLLVGELADKFGNLGVVCVAVAERSDRECVISSFVMSCRAMGFGMEQLVLANLVEEHSRGLDVVGRFVPTSRNEPASNLYGGAGFVERAPGEWALPREWKVAAPTWIRVQKR